MTSDATVLAHSFAHSFAHSVTAASVPGGRLGPTLAALLGIPAVVLGWRSFRGLGRVAPRPAAVVGLGGATIAGGVTFILLADGGPGTGNGVVGSLVAIVLGLATAMLGIVARARDGRAAAAGGQSV